MSDTALGLIYIVAFSHGLLLTIFLWRKSSDKKRYPGKWLAIISLLISYKLLEGGCLYLGLYTDLAHFMDLLTGEVLWIGPLLFTYTQRVAGRPKPPVYLWLLHFIPAIALWFYNSPSVFQSIEGKVRMWDYVLNAPGDNLLPVQYIFLFLAIKTHLSVYLYLSWREVKTLTAESTDFRSDNSCQLLVNIKLLILTFFILELVWAGLFIGQQYFGLGTLAMVSNIWLLLVASVVLSIVFIGSQKPDLVFTQEERSLAQRVTLDGSADSKLMQGSNVKYLHSTLPESTSKMLSQELELQIKNKQLYLNEKLTLTDLAKATGIKSHTLSQVINQSMKTNFYKLINSWRIQHAIDLIDDDKVNWSLERIALESGFGNRVTFSKAFKEIMHCTPSQYKKDGKQKTNAE